MKYNLFKIWLLLAFLSFGAVPVSMMAQPNTQYEITSYGQFNLIPGVVLSHYTLPGVLAYRWMVPNVTTTSEFMELRRMLGAYELYLVSDHTYTGSPDFLYGSDYGSWSGLLHPNQIDILHSLDRRTNGMGMIVSGFSETFRSVNGFKLSGTINIPIGCTVSFITQACPGE